MIFSNRLHFFVNWCSKVLYWFGHFLWHFCLSSKKTNTLFCVYNVQSKTHVISVYSNSLQYSNALLYLHKGSFPNHFPSLTPDCICINLPDMRSIRKRLHFLLMVFSVPWVHRFFNTLILNFQICFKSASLLVTNCANLRYWSNYKLYQPVSL